MSNRYDISLHHGDSYPPGPEGKLVFAVMEGPEDSRTPVNLSGVTVETEFRSSTSGPDAIAPSTALRDQAEYPGELELWIPASESEKLRILSYHWALILNFGNDRKTTICKGKATIER